MKKTRIIGRMLLAMLALCIVTGCSDELDESRNDLQGKNTLQIKFETPEFNQLNTRAVSESGINDVTILVIKNGVVQEPITPQGNFTQGVTVDVPALPAATLDDAGKLVENSNENLICFFANVGEDAKALEGKTYKDVQNFTTTLTEANLLALEYIPMYGIYTNGVVKGVTNQINVSLTRALAKITFTVNTDNFQLRSGEELAGSPTVTDIKLHNVPLTVTFPGKSNRPALPENGQNGVWPETPQQPYPAYTEASFISISKKDADKMSGNTATNQFIAYMPENARGSYNDVTTYAQKKNPDTWNEKGKDIKGLTYIEVTLNYTTTESVIREVKYVIYLGGNDKGDMNIRANAHYNVTANIYGDNADEDVNPNITVTDLFNLGNVEHTTEKDSEGKALKLQDKAKDLANCYIVDATNKQTDFYLNLMQARKGWTDIQARMADEQPYVDELDKLLKSGKWTIETLWHTQSALNDVTNYITGGKVEEDWKDTGDGVKNYFAKLTFNASVANGNNAVIVLKAASDIAADTYSTIKAGDILWSWHIWLTDYNPDVTPVTGGQVHAYFGDAFTKGIYQGKVMMDRNLGATVTNFTSDVAADATDYSSYYGFYYQYGRKDPFKGKAETADTDMLQVTNSEKNYVKSVRSPQMFFNLGANNSGHWTSVSDSDNDLWSSKGVKSAFDPCPPGWRVPVGSNTDAMSNPWAGFADGSAGSVASTKEYNAESAFFDLLQTENGHRLYVYGEEGSEVKAFYPASGYRNFTTGLLGSAGSGGYCWSASPNSTTHAYSLRFTTSEVNPTYSYRAATGFPVRCVKE